MLGGARRIAMQYSPNNAIMYVSMVDAGTVEFLRGLGKQIVSSADMVSQFEAVLSEEQIASHTVAQKAIDEILAEGWKEMGRRLRPSNGKRGAGLTEFDHVQWLSKAMRNANLVWENGPNVSVNANSSDSHYEPTAEKCAPITDGTPAIIVADVDGVTIAGLLFDAGSSNSPNLLQIGDVSVSTVDHSANPTAIFDISCRVGGAAPAAANE